MKRQAEGRVGLEPIKSGRWGGSRVTVWPPKLLTALGMDEGDEFLPVLTPDGVRLYARRQRRLAAVVEGLTPQNQHEGPW
ncbi:hypothetical protein Dcar01_01816 [Deinococcus carri]|uniref:SpoVT-AbrB domain-containing protein n=1 Tax=Deinococcus carri TaxID=1211323 RepID=A0ABP9W6U6_9DEIO